MVSRTVLILSLALPARVGQGQKLASFAQREIAVFNDALRDATRRMDNAAITQLWRRAMAPAPRDVESGRSSDPSTVDSPRP